MAHPLERLCAGCDGTGTVANEEWEEWDSQRAQLCRQRAGADGAAVLAALLDERVAEHEDSRPPHPRQGPCADCHGAGTVVTVEGEELLAFLRRHLPRP